MNEIEAGKYTPEALSRYADALKNIADVYRTTNPSVSTIVANASDALAFVAEGDLIRGASLTKQVNGNDQDVAATVKLDAPARRGRPRKES